MRKYYKLRTNNPDRARKIDDTRVTERVGPRCPAEIPGEKGILCFITGSYCEHCDANSCERYKHMTGENKRGI